MLLVAVLLCVVVGETELDVVTLPLHVADRVPLLDAVADTDTARESVESSELKWMTKCSCCCSSWTETTLEMLLLRLVVDGDDVDEDIEEIVGGADTVLVEDSVTETVVVTVTLTVTEPDSVALVLRVVDADICTAPYPRRIDIDTIELSDYDCQRHRRLEVVCSM